MSAGSQVRRWPLLLIAAPAAVAVWSGWVGLGGLCGFGVIHPLPGIWDSLRLNTAITLPVGVEAYGAYALGAWLAPLAVPETARKFARRSAIGALALGMTGQVIYHLLAAAHAIRAPWPVVVLVSCMPVVTLGFGAALTHLLRGQENKPASARPPIAAKEPARRPGRATLAARQTHNGRRSVADMETAALAVLARQPGVSGAALGRAIGVSTRTGQRVLSRLSESNEHNPTTEGVNQ